MLNNLSIYNPGLPIILDKTPAYFVLYWSELLEKSRSQKQQIATAKKNNPRAQNLKFFG